jgi:hypothetical protein
MKQTANARTTDFNPEASKENASIHFRCDALSNVSVFILSDPNHKSSTISIERGIQIDINELQ